MRPVTLARCVLFAVALGFAAASAQAGPWEDAQSAYEQGDYATALQLLRPLADQGHADAQLSLGTIYQHGWGVPQDEAEAVKWYHLAADQGLAGAQEILGLMYYRGRGVPQDFVQAHMWLNLAASRLPPAFFIRDSSAKTRDELAARMTPEQIAEAQRLAREWKPK